VTEERERQRRQSLSSSVLNDADDGSGGEDGGRKRGAAGDGRYPRVLTHDLYTSHMKPLQFKEAEIIREDEDSGDSSKIRFVVPFHFERDVRSSMAGGGAAGQVQSGRLKRLAQEMVSLSSALPLSFSSTVFVRCDTDRLDVMKVCLTIWGLFCHCSRIFLILGGPFNGHSK
jgi:hypothetical protein